MPLLDNISLCCYIAPTLPPCPTEVSMSSPHLFLNGTGGCCSISAVRSFFIKPSGQPFKLPKVKTGVDLFCHEVKEEGRPSFPAEGFKDCF